MIYYPKVSKILTQPTQYKIYCNETDSCIFLLRDGLPNVKELSCYKSDKDFRRNELCLCKVKLNLN